MKGLLNMPARAQEPGAKPAAKAKKAADEKDEKMVVTTIRFKRGTLAALKKVAIDRNQSLQEMIEGALVEVLEKDGVKIQGLRR